MKRCSKCHAITTEFHKSNSICKECRKKYDAANKEKNRARNIKYRAKKKQKLMWKVVPAATQRKIRAYATSYATKWGFPNLADEYAQDMIEAKARGQNRSNKHVWTDLLRSQFGRSSKDEHNPNADRNWEHLDSMKIGCEDVHDETLGYVTKCLNELYPENISLPRISFLLHVNHGLTLKEIAELFFRTESRICFAVKEVQQALAKKLTG